MASIDKGVFANRVSAMAFLPWEVFPMKKHVPKANVHFLKKNYSTVYYMNVVSSNFSKLFDILKSLNQKTPTL